MIRRLAALAAALLTLGILPRPRSGATAAEPCPIAVQTAPLPWPEKALQRARASATAAPGTYSAQLQPTPLGWPVLEQWCVWIEPLAPQASSGGANSAEALRQRQWRQAVIAALEQWQTLLPITVVEQAERAQVRLWRRRPPLQRLADGRTRASHGRALLQLLQVRRGELVRPEPHIEVLLSPDQRATALQATALHELGHAFGLWGHSDDPGDAMAAVPGAIPVLRLSQRDRDTMHWLRRQGVRLQTPAEPAQNRTAEPQPPLAPKAD